MTLRLYNTLTRTKEVFTPIDPNNVRMYVCGPTVYDFAHIGNARPVIVFDVLFRLLRHLYGPEHVTYVRNITDVDDKINARALRDFPDLPLNDAIRRVTEKTANQFHADVKSLGCLEPTHEPRATENIPGMIEMIRMLIANGHAYEAAGEVLFSVTSMPDYGQLSKRTLEEQQAGARVAVEAHKKNPADFVLWKLSSPEEPGWDSPWGRGRPGWHIECSEMSRKYLGQVFDIHGGGLDLIFPHHENELAQSRCAFGTSVMANVWMHNGFLQVEGQKMSKSLGNFYTISELLDTSNFGGRKWPGEVLRLAMLLSHYREPIDFSFSRLLEAERMLARFKEIAAGRIDRRLDRSLHDQFHLQLSDDLNTPMALRVLDQASADLSPRTAYTLYCCLKFLGFSGNRTKLATTSDKLTSVVKAVSQMTAGDFNRLMASAVRHTHFPSGRLKPEAEILDNLYKIYQLVNEHGTFFQNWAQNDANLRHYRFVFSVDPRESEIDELVALRLESRKAKNWAESDRIRDELAAMGIAIKDNKDGTTSWEVKR